MSVDDGWVMMGDGLGDGGVTMMGVGDAWACGRVAVGRVVVQIFGLRIVTEGTCVAPSVGQTLLRRGTVPACVDG